MKNRICQWVSVTQDWFCSSHQRNAQQKEYIYIYIPHGLWVLMLERVRGSLWSLHTYILIQSVTFVHVYAMRVCFHWWFMVVITWNELITYSLYLCIVVSQNQTVLVLSAEVLRYQPSSLMQQRWTELCKLALQRVLKCDIAKLPWQIIKYVKYSSHLVTAFSQKNEPQKTAHSDSLKTKKDTLLLFWAAQMKFHECIGYGGQNLRGRYFKTSAGKTTTMCMVNWPFNILLNSIRKEFIRCDMK